MSALLPEVSRVLATPPDSQERAVALKAFSEANRHKAISSEALLLLLDAWSDSPSTHTHTRTHGDSRMLVLCASDDSLLELVLKAVRYDGPSSYFRFSDSPLLADVSGGVGPRGYSIFTWIYIDAPDPPHDTDPVPVSCFRLVRHPHILLFRFAKLCCRYVLYHRDSRSFIVVFEENGDNHNV